MRRLRVTLSVRKLRNDARRTRRTRARLIGKKGSNGSDEDAEDSEGSRGPGLAEVPESRRLCAMWWQHAPVNTRGVTRAASRAKDTPLDVSSDSR